MDDSAVKAQKQWLVVHGQAVLVAEEDKGLKLAGDGLDQASKQGAKVEQSTVKEMKSKISAERALIQTPLDLVADSIKAKANSPIGAAYRPATHRAAAATSPADALRGATHRTTSRSSTTVAGSAAIPSVRCTPPPRSTTNGRSTPHPRSTPRARSSGSLVQHPEQHPGDAIALEPRRLPRERGERRPARLAVGGPQLQHGGPRPRERHPREIAAIVGGGEAPCPPQRSKRPRARRRRRRAAGGEEGEGDGEADHEAQRKPR